MDKTGRDESGAEGDPSAMGAEEPLPALKRYEYVVRYRFTIRARSFSDALAAIRAEHGDKFTGEITCL